jgi:hypothetical protein
VSTVYVGLHKDFQYNFSPAAAEIKTSEVLIILQPFDICANTAALKKVRLVPFCVFTYQSSLVGCANRLR